MTRSIHTRSLFAPLRSNSSAFPLNKPDLFATIRCRRIYTAQYTELQLHFMENTTVEIVDFHYVSSLCYLF